MRRSQFLLMGFIAALGAACTSAPTASVATAGEATPAPATDPSPEAPTVNSPQEVTGAGGEIVFRIVPDQSEARFLIDEVLAGSPKVVVGTTSDVSGEITGAFASPQSVSVGPIQVDMSTLRTDNSFRNRALHDAILQTGSEANRFALFQVTAIDGLPPEVVFGAPYELSLVGDLTIHGVTRPVVFAGVVTPVSESRLEGTASVSLPYSDFGIQILRLPPQVASVGDTVTLEIDFVAEPG
jgi:polyisoprenoid-binding protein YceI